MTNDASFDRLNNQTTINDQSIKQSNNQSNCQKSTKLVDKWNEPIKQQQFNQWSNQSIWKRWIKQSNDQSNNQTINWSNNQSNSQMINCSISHIINQTIKQSLKQSGNHCTINDKSIQIQRSNSWNVDDEMTLQSNNLVNHYDQNINKSNNQPLIM
jgi:hypothetical protein